ncbi:MAG TPA: hypothetical protein VFW96_15275 [Thermomicrobiales bacterium]|nr:hypothetical protein [Thermomicrobiales bacterium]
MPFLFFLFIPLIFVPFFFHPGFLWVAFIVLFVLWRRPGGCGRPRRVESRAMPAPAPRPASPPAGDGPTWPGLYDDERGRPARPAQNDRGKIEYF